MNNDFHLILPNIRSCHNVGAMFRTADAFAVDKLWLVGYTAAPPKVQIDKVSLGAETWIPFEKIEMEDMEGLIVKLKEQDFSIIALEKTVAHADSEAHARHAAGVKFNKGVKESVDVTELELIGPVALIVGNEVDGISENILSSCDMIAHITMLGKKESLNVSVAAGVAMHEVRKKLSGS